jgi:hypothetical protein
MSLLICLITSNLWADSTLTYEAEKKGIKLTEKDREALEIGEISTARYIIGGVLGTYPIGLGLGHAVQNRWSEQGWKFTAGELASLGLVIGGALGCADDAVEDAANNEDEVNCSDLESAIIITGIVGYIGFRIWEAVDVWVMPPGHNRKVKELKEYINKEQAPAVKSSLYLVPVLNPRIGGQGLGLTYTF